MKRYLVGGAVRDQLLGIRSKDKDWVIVGATPQQMLDAGYVSVGNDFVFLHPETKEEHALARTERKSGKGYTGFTFDTSVSVTLEDDQYAVISLLMLLPKTIKAHCTIRITGSKILKTKCYDTFLMRFLKIHYKFTGCSLPLVTVT